MALFAGECFHVFLQQSRVLQGPGHRSFGKTMDTVLIDKQDWHAPAIDLLIKFCSDGICFHIIFTIVDIVFVEKANRGLAGGAPDRTEHQDIRRAFRIQPASLVALLAGYSYLALAIGMLNRHTLCLNNDKQDEHCKYGKP